MRILLINPNTSTQTSAMMARIVSDLLPAGCKLVSLTAPRGVAMIVNEAQLKLATDVVVELALAHKNSFDAVLIGAFGDPGLDELRAHLHQPVTGICEASMLEAAKAGRRFGIATVTPDLVACFVRKARALGLESRFCGTRLADGDPLQLTADFARLTAELAIAVDKSWRIDSAEAVIIGGGPLGDAATSLAGRFPIPIISPLAAAVRQLFAMLAEQDGAINR